MALMEWIARTIRQLDHSSEEYRSREKAREALRSGEADRMPLEEFERRFNISDVDFNAKTDGFPKSSYYGDDQSPEEAEQARKKLDAFLAER